MLQVGGMDGEDKFLSDTAYGETAMSPRNRDEEQDNANYARYYSVEKTDANGVANRLRGYSDQNLYVALTENKNVVPRKLTYCETKEDCTTIEQRVSYAIPLEIIYTTPLQRWNPYNLNYYDGPEKNTPTKGGRNGDSEGTAYNGTARTVYFTIPAELYGESSEKDPSDTGKDNVWVLDPEGNSHKTRAGGVSIIMEEIKDVGRIRQRYPIAPLYSEGSLTQKQLDALKEMVTHPSTYSFMYHEALATASGSGNNVTK